MCVQQHNMGMPTKLCHASVEFEFAHDSVTARCAGPAVKAAGTCDVAGLSPYLCTYFLSCFEHRRYPLEQSSDALQFGMPVKITGAELVMKSKQYSLRRKCTLLSAPVSVVQRKFGTPLENACTIARLLQ